MGKKSMNIYRLILYVFLLHLTISMIGATVFALDAPKTNQFASDYTINQNTSKHCDVDEVISKANRVTLETEGSKKVSHLLDEGIAILSKGDFHKAFIKMRMAYQKDPYNIKLRRCLVVLQKLSSRTFFVKRIENRWQSDLSRDVLRDLIEQAKLIHRGLDDLSPELETVPKSFTQVRNLLKLRVMDLIVNIDLAQQIQHSLSLADNAFARGNYAEELRWFKKAKDLGWKDNDGLLQGSQLISKSQDAMAQEQQIKAINLLEQVRTNDRHYSVAQEIMKQARLQIKEHDLIDEIDKAWSTLAWKQLQQLIRHPDTVAARSRAVRLRSILTTTERLLRGYEKYANSVPTRDLAEMALSCIEMKQIVSQRQPVSNRYAEFLEWVTNQQMKLMPQIEAQLELLFRKANTAWNTWDQNRISETEINTWDTKTNYDDVRIRFQSLSIAYSNYIEAARLIQAVPERPFDSSVPLLEVRAQFVTICQRALDRARILEAFEDYTAAIRIYEILAALPEVKGRNDVEQAQRRLENLRKLPLHRTQK